VGSCSHTADNFCSPAFDLLARTTLTVVDLNVMQRANNFFTLQSNLTTVTVDTSVSGELAYTVGRPLSTSHWIDQFYTSAFSPMLLLAATRSPKANFLPTSCTIPFVNTQLSVITVLATAMAFFGLFLMAMDQHFRWCICALLSMAYWSSALWIAWSVSSVGGELLLLAGVCRGAVLLFGDVDQVRCVCTPDFGLRCSLYACVRVLCVCVCVCVCVTNHRLSVLVCMQGGDTMCNISNEIACLAFNLLSLAVIPLAP
jgi:hypothetical protein